MKQQLQLDGVRFLATVVAKSAGSKKIKKPSDLMKLPLIDGKPDKDKLARLVEFYESEKAKRDGNGKPGNNN